MTRTSIEGLFPTPVGFYRWEPGINQKELDLLTNLKQRPNEGNTTSEDSYLFKLKNLKRLHTFSQECVDDYLRTVICPKDNVSLYCTQAWANYTKFGQFHHRHTHQNSIVSGVFYVNANKDSDRIKFFATGYEKIKVHAAEYNIFNSESWWFSVETNMLVLFPSHLPHMVETVNGDHTRISLAFNTFYKGSIGSEVELTHLQL